MLLRKTFIQYFEKHFSYRTWGIYLFTVWRYEPKNLPCLIFIIQFPLIFQLTFFRWIQFFIFERYIFVTLFLRASSYSSFLFSNIAFEEHSIFIRFCTIFGILLRIDSGWSLLTWRYLVLSFCFLNGPYSLLSKLKLMSR